VGAGAGAAADAASPEMSPEVRQWCWESDPIWHNLEVPGVPQIIHVTLGIETYRFIEFIGIPHEKRKPHFCLVMLPKRYYWVAVDDWGL